MTTPIMSIALAASSTELVILPIWSPIVLVALEV